MNPDNINPITIKEYEKLFDQLNISPDSKIAIGLSGGSDSMLLAFLEHQRNPNCLALICDHGLRAESKQEAELVYLRAQALGIRAKIISLNMPSTNTAIQEKARNIRYAAITLEMLKNGFEPGKGILLIGHHKLDQAETVSLRLMQNSGQDGLAGMADIRDMECFKIARPLLHIQSQRIKPSLLQANINWVEDPSNQNPKYTRVRVREQLKSNPDELERLIKLSAEAGEQRKHQQIQALETAYQSVQSLYPGNSIKIDENIFKSDSISIKAFKILLQAVGSIQQAGGNKIIDLKSVEKLMQNGQGSLSGVLLTKINDNFWLSRENQNIMPINFIKQWDCWDGRYRCLQAVDEDYQLSCIGDSVSQFKPLRRDLGMPALVFSSIPCWRKNDQIVGIPELGFGTNPSGLLRINPELLRLGASYIVEDQYKQKLQKDSNQRVENNLTLKQNDLSRFHY